MNNTELTMSEVLRDPIIRLMLRADRVPLGEFARLLQKVAEDRNRAVAKHVVDALGKPN